MTDRFDTLDAARAAVTALEPTQLRTPWPHRWSASQMLVHCAQSIDASRTGYPAHRPRWFQATIGRLVLSRFLSKGRMSHDVTGAIPGLAEPVDGPLDEAKRTLLAAIEAFEKFEGTPAPHFVYGPVTKAQYARVHAMHVADHFAAMTGAT